MLKLKVETKALDWSYSDKVVQEKLFDVSESVTIESLDQFTYIVDAETALIMVVPNHRVHQITVWDPTSTKTT